MKLIDLVGSSEGKLMKGIGLLVSALGALALGGCSVTTPYLFTVTENGSPRPVEGASVELTPEGTREVKVNASTDDHGESTLELPHDQRFYLVVTFDGTTDRYLLRTESVPVWDAPGAELGQELRFLAGAPSSGTSPAWLVRVRRLR